MKPFALDYAVSKAAVTGMTRSLARELGRALDHLVIGYAARGQYETAIAYARQLLALDPLREEAHRQLMLLYARSNQRSRVAIPLACSPSW